MIGNTHRLRVERNPWEDERSISRDGGEKCWHRLCQSAKIASVRFDWRIVIREKMTIDGEERKQEETINDQFQED